MTKTIVLFLLSFFLFFSTFSQVPCSVSVIQDPTTMDQYGTAYTNTNQYINDQNLNLSAYSFAFNIDNNFMTYVNNRDITFFHFILAENPNSNNQLIIYMIGVNSNYNHIYMQDATNHQYYVFKNTSFSSTVQIPQPPKVQGAFTVPLTRSYSQNNIDALNSVPNWIKAYSRFTGVAGQKKFTGAYSYVIPAKALRTYISGANSYASDNETSLSKLLVYFGDNVPTNPIGGDKIDIILLAQDANANAVYINNANSYYALEYCNPCPECIGLLGSNAQQLETPCPANPGLPIKYINMKIKGNFEKAYTN